jgi:Ca-activated chloride channel family protein
MNEAQILPDDPRLTAYALGELDPADRTAIEAALQRDPALRRAVEEIRTAAVRLEAALAAETAREPLAPAMAPRATVEREYRHRRSWTRTLVGFPQFYYVVGGLAAAVFAVIVALREERPKTTLLAIDLTAPASETPTTGRGVRAAPPAAGPENAFVATTVQPRSALSLDAAASSFSMVRERLQRGTLPSRDAVQIEELLNAFPYRYVPPADSAPFAASLEVAEAPWAPEHRLVRIGVKARELASAERPALNLVLVVGGSAGSPDRWPVVQESIRRLVAQLRADDRVAIVAPSTRGDVALRVTAGSQQREILAAIDALSPATMADDARGLAAGYELARSNLIAGGLNRLVFCTHGDASATTPTAGLAGVVEGNAPSGVALTVLDFEAARDAGAALAQLAQKGRGRYGRIASPRDVAEMPADLLVPVAENASLHVEFNPATVSSYRLLGYEHPAAARGSSGETVDGVSVGAGRSFTALYEIVPASASVATRAADPGELLVAKINYREPAGTADRELAFPLLDTGGRFVDASAEFKFAAAVAEFGMLLRDSPHKGRSTWGDVMAWGATGTSGSDGRAEFVALARQAQNLMQ